MNLLDRKLQATRFEGPEGTVTIFAADLTAEEVAAQSPEDIESDLARPLTANECAEVLTYCRRRSKPGKPHPRTACWEAATLTRRAQEKAAMPKTHPPIDDADAQMVALALAHLAVARPGLETAISAAAERLEITTAYRAQHQMATGILDSPEIEATLAAEQEALRERWPFLRSNPT